jgi:broad specificity phosphatase PhoE
VRTLILVKHSVPEVVPDLPAAPWRLGDEGRRRCGVLADRMVAYDPVVVATRIEPKATETAAIVAARLGRQVVAVEGLHEHDRSNVAFLGDAEFRAAVARCLTRANDLVFGRETATEARRRFERAVDRVVCAYPHGNVAIVAHGTVIALLVAACAGTDAVHLWRRLGLPSFVVLSLPDRRLLSVVDAVS